MKKIYLSGAITGKEEQAKKLFQKAENKLEKMGYHVVNPFNLPHKHDKRWSSYMREDLAALLGCDTIFLLKGWESSRGARLEQRIANDLDMHIIIEGFNENKIVKSKI